MSYGWICSKFIFLRNNAIKYKGNKSFLKENALSSLFWIKVIATYTIHFSQCQAVCMLALFLGIILNKGIKNFIKALKAIFSIER
ncbi:hypothetical protein HCW_08320 [Helicobacter cetorum MIT 00-7128]|uniref:Uncharacterized protein n=1 Tax=Helicobacter cetorum (strain ATCC BAA-429 / MIT 00-7128) TaxID=182217 RepID=I0EPQ2_HELC0|nr:hypothetical protein HCW_01745 [Helicobacter cetorum MIT 00-7128]AFI04921.1 hypothetical protein HCW_08320 [Helicobacter cetorum MIT 00-7128]